jgi:hypothetical protein
MKKATLSEWILFESIHPQDLIDKYNKKFFSKVVAYRFMKDEPSLKCIAVIHWMPSTKVYFGVLFTEETPAKCLYSLESKTVESLKLKIDLKLKEFGYKVNIF